MNRKSLAVASVRAVDLAVVFAFFGAFAIALTAVFSADAHAQVASILTDNKVTDFMKIVFGIVAAIMVWDFFQSMLKGDDGLIKKGLFTVFAIYLATSYETFVGWLNLGF